MWIFNSIFGNKKSRYNCCISMSSSGNASPQSTTMILSSYSKTVMFIPICSRPPSGIIFNLLPLYPLDGGRIFKGMLETRLNCQKVNKIISKTSESVLIILTIISSIAVYYFKNIAIFLICIFLWEIIIKRKSNKTLDILRRK